MPLAYYARHGQPQIDDQCDMSDRKFQRPNRLFKDFQLIMPCSVRLLKHMNAMIQKFNEIVYVKDASLGFKQLNECVNHSNQIIALLL